MVEAVNFDTMAGVSLAEKTVKMFSEPGAAWAEAAMVKGELHWQSAGNSSVSSTFIDARIAGHWRERFDES